MFEKRSTAFVKFSIVLSASAVFNAVADTVLDVPLQHDLSAAVQRGFRGVDLRQNILTGHILVNHAVDGLHLSNDFFQTAMQVLCSPCIASFAPPPYH